MDFKAVAASALARAETLAPAWLPGGKRRGHEWVCGDLHGGAGESCSVNLLTGKWADFAGDVKGGDLISLYAAIHNISQLEAAKELDDTPVKLNGHAGAVEHHDDDEQIQRPPNVDFQPSMFKHSRHGTPSKFWIYRDAEGPICAVARYDVTGEKKQIVPWIWNSLKWKAQAPPKPRPLYGLDRLSLSGSVLLVEGEKTADAGFRYWPKRPCLTWMGGVAGHKYADWEPLRGREVTLWPDADTPGTEAMAGIAGRLIALDCKVRIVHTLGEFSEGWDLADAEQEGRTGAEMVAYARQHSKDISPPRELERVQEMPPPGSQTYQEAPGPTSMLAKWEALNFDRKSTGKPYANQLNVTRAIDDNAELDIHYDSFAQRIMAGRHEWSDDICATFTTTLQEKYGLSEIRPHVVQEGVKSYAFTHRKNPVQSWLNSLTWDSEPRLRDLISIGMGAKPGAYSGAVGRCFMVGMVARVLQAGCKVDQMPIFEGAQGVGKSTALSIIGGKYFSEIHDSITNKDFYLSITGKMLCEISELSAFTRTEINRIKGVISNPCDRYRTPYGMTAADHPRACVFAGTTNSDDWNTDETGARRFWPVRCGDINRGWLEDNRDQMFAEAVWRYNAGEQWWNVPEEEANLQREARMEVDPWQAIMQSYCDAHDAVAIPTIIGDVLRLEVNHQTMLTQRRVGKILTQMGFKKTVIRGTEGKQSKRWVRK